MTERPAYTLKKGTKTTLKASTLPHNDSLKRPLTLPPQQHSFPSKKPHLDMVYVKEDDSESEDSGYDINGLIDDEASEGSSSEVEVSKYNGQEERCTFTMN